MYYQNSTAFSKSPSAPEGKPVSPSPPAFLIDWKNCLRSCVFKSSSMLTPL